MKKLIALLLAMIMVLSMVACGAADAPAADAPAADAPAADAPAADAPTDTRYKIGFANIGEVNETCMAVKRSFEAAAEKYDFDLVYMNNDMDGATAVKNADNMVQQGVDGLVEFNIDASVGATLKSICDDAGIPLIAIDIGIDGVPFFGGDNAQVGVVGGRHLGKVAQERWGEEPDILLLIEDSTSGETPMPRVRNMPEGLRETFPDFPDEKIYTLDGAGDAADVQKLVSDFLTAHPDANKIAIGAFQDIIAPATLAAIETAGRESDCIMVCASEYSYLDYLKANPDPVENEVYVGGVAFFFPRYADYIIPVMIDMINGKEAPAEFFVEHEVLTRENAAEFYADYLNS